MFWKILKWIAGLFLPMFSRPRLSPGLLWFLHLLLIAGITVGLYFLHQYLELSKIIEGRLLWVRNVWLPLLFLLLYFVAWQAWWVYKLLQPEARESPFPDLDEAWGQVIGSLEKAGIGIGDTPVFLVFGKVAGADEAMFQAVPSGLAVTGATPGGSPVRAFANRDAIFVTCPGASLLGNPGQVQEGGPSGGMNLGESIGRGRADLGASIGMEKSIGMGGSVGGDIGRVQQIIRSARDQNRSLSPVEQAEIRRLSGGGSPAVSRAGGSGGAKGGQATLMQDPYEVEYRTARLTYLCSLIAKSRWPLCPVNGAIVYVSMADCEKEEVAQQIGLIGREDLSVAADTLKLQFPVYSLLGGIETLPGGSEFLMKFAPERKGQRLGKSFPLAPDLSPEAAADQAEAAALWVFHSLLPYWVFKLFAVERGGEPPTTSVRANAELFNFLDAVRTRGRAASRLIGRIATAGPAGPVRFGGCYLTANAPELGSGPLFLDEFFKKVVQSQGFVEWSEAAFAEDTAYRRSTTLGYVAIAAIVLAVMGLAGFVIYTNQQGQ